MRTIAVLLLLAAPAGAAETKLPLRACVKWSKEIPDAKAAGAGLFDSVERVEGASPFLNCDVVIETDSFGVGWLMRAYMRENVLSPCGKMLGSYKFGYKGDKWQEKLVTELHRWLVKHPEALVAAKACPEVAATAAAAPPPPAPVAASTEAAKAP